MSSEDVEDFMYRSPFLDREALANEMLNRQGDRTVSDAARQNELEKIQSGIMEGSGIGSQSLYDEQKEEEPDRPRRRDPRQGILGGSLTADNLRRVRDSVMDVYNSSRGATVDYFTEGSNIMDMVDVMQDMRLVSRESAGAGALNDVLSSIDSVSSIWSDVSRGSESRDDEGNLDYINRMYQDIFGEDLGGADLNNDGEISQSELNLAINQTSENNAMLKSIHPLLLKSLTTNDFKPGAPHTRQIKKKKITEESPRTRNDQTNLVTQGLAAYDKDKNLYNVKY
jgi:hypothetical protein